MVKIKIDGEDKFLTDKEADNLLEEIKHQLQDLDSEWLEMMELRYNEESSSIIGYATMLPVKES